jgi:mannose-6-phosphate isomerase
MAASSDSRCPIPPFTLIPKQQPTVWGGHKLHTMLGKPALDDQPVGESWEVWAGDTVADGPWVGMRLEELTERYPAELLGAVPYQRSPNRFPLLTKFIDAQEALSVQVHPNDTQARTLEGQDNGKTEAWYIITAAPDAWVIHGLEQPVSAPILEQRLRAGTADELLHHVPVHAGDTLFVPAGTIHAIGPGILLHEVQQTRDITYRLYDWNRQAHGSKRELHLEKGLQVASLQPSPTTTVKPLLWRAGENDLFLLVACEYFALKKMRLRTPYTLDTQRQSFHIITVLEGACVLHSAAEFAPLQLGRGRSAVIPACWGQYQLVPEPEATVLVEYVADIQHELVPELQSFGLAPAAIESFLTQFELTRA